MMAIAHHPGPESLMSCSAGSMPEAFAAVMASHISICPACRKELALLEDIGVELFRNISPAALEREVPVAVMRRAETEDSHRVSAHAAEASGDVPAPLVPFAGNSLACVPWRRLAPGVQHFPIRLSPGQKGALRLVKVAPGAVLPEHGHGGSELTLVLAGAYTDKTGRYAPGDLADLSDSTEHQPIADPIEGCVCLIASDKKIRFKSVMARLMQPFTRF